MQSSTLNTTYPLLYQQCKLVPNCNIFKVLITVSKPLHTANFLAAFLPKIVKISTDQHSYCKNWKGIVSFGIQCSVIVHFISKFKFTVGIFINAFCFWAFYYQALHLLIEISCCFINVVQMSKLLQQLSIRLRWQLHRQEMLVRSHRPRTCLQHVHNKKSKADECRSTNWHSRQRSQHKRQLPPSFQLHWCLEQLGSLQAMWLFPRSHNRSLLFSQTLMHQWVLHHIHRAKTHFYEVLHEVINDWMRCLCWKQLLPVHYVIMRQNCTAFYSCGFCAHNLWHGRHCRCLFLYWIAAHWR